MDSRLCRIQSTSYIIVVILELINDPSDCMN